MLLDCLVDGTEDDLVVGEAFVAGVTLRLGVGQGATLSANWTTGRNCSYGVHPVFTHGGEYADLQGCLNPGGPISIRYPIVSTKLPLSG